MDNMTIKELNEWFRGLDSNDLSYLFPSEYEHVMESAEPGVDINTFNKMVKHQWKEMHKEEKMKLYKMWYNF